MSTHLRHSSHLLFFATSLSLIFLMPLLHKKLEKTSNSGKSGKTTLSSAKSSKSSPKWASEVPSPHPSPDKTTNVTTYLPAMPSPTNHTKKPMPCPKNHKPCSEKPTQSSGGKGLKLEPEPWGKSGKGSKSKKTIIFGKSSELSSSISNSGKSKAGGSKASTRTFAKSLMSKGLSMSKLWGTRGRSPR